MGFHFKRPHNQIIQHIDYADFDEIYDDFDLDEYPLDEIHDIMDEWFMYGINGMGDG